MQKTLKILVSQLNPTVGAIYNNEKKIIDIIKTYQKTHDLIIFPELALSGYPPEDLLLNPDFFAQIQGSLKKIQQATDNCHVILGHPAQIDNAQFNCLSVFNNQQCCATYAKQHLPNYDVFDEKRYFTPGKETTCIIDIKGFRIGCCICEDLWQPGPVEALAKEKIDLLVSINASPFDTGKCDARKRLLMEHAKNGFGIVYVNLTGGQDELVFDGQSFAMNKLGQIQFRGSAFKEENQTIDFTNQNFNGLIKPETAPTALIYEALCCGLRDYIIKNGFKSVLIGLSGGIDSALTLAIACDALGSSHVHAVLMPSRYTSQISIDDALLQAQELNVKTSILSIEPTFETLLKTLPSVSEIARQNLQARIRGVILMALSNTSGDLVLSTSNKSETAVGYATLYGDMCGAFSVLKDVLKTTVYALASFRNKRGVVIPERVINRAPSAELAHDQMDQDTLPPYDKLDAIITDIMDNHLSIEELIQKGHNDKHILQVTTLMKQNEYKRRQSAPGVKITACAFGRDWRFPITSGFYACKIVPNR